MLNSWSTFGSTHSHTHKRTQTRLINTSEIFESGFKPSECKGVKGERGKGIMFCLQFEKF